MIHVFKRIKSDLREMYDLLQENQEYEQQIKRDMQVAQQIITNSLSKLKREIAKTKNTNGGQNENY